jgi:CelD/BcsL family acetyltransferase involved in cellulose biosynthesis
MVTRIQRVLRLLIALTTLSCAGLLTAEPVAAAPSAYASALALAPGGAISAAPVTVKLAHGRAGQRSARPSAALVQLSAAVCSASGYTSPALKRAPRLYLRHCVLLR